MFIYLKLYFILLKNGTVHFNCVINSRAYFVGKLIENKDNKFGKKGNELKLSPSAAQVINQTINQ